MQRLDSSLPFLEALEVLKSLKRAGWCNRNIPDPENVGNHMYQMIWHCCLHPELRDEHRNKAVMMCVVHDIGEITAGDITPADGVDPERKYLEEKLGIKYLCCLLTKSNPQLASNIFEVWEEYEEGETDIAKLVHQIDKLECLHQAFIYMKRHGRNHKLQDFKDQRLKISDRWLSDQADRILAEWAIMEQEQTSSRIIFVTGGPGVGKGTLCSRLAETFDYEHISVGDLLRAERDTAGSVFGDFIAQSMRHSVIVPPSLTLLLLRDKVQKSQAQGRGVLIDGFPRSVRQALAFEQEISPTYSTIFLDCPSETMVQRVQQRSVSSNREDDDTAILTKRINTFLQSNASVLDHLGKNKLSKVDCTGSVDDAFSAVATIVRSLDNV